MLGRAWPAQGEPLFLPEDTQLALEWQAEQDVLCPGCGLPVDETMDPDNEDAYAVHVYVCAACAATERKATANAEVDLPGAYYTAELETGDGATTP